MQILKQSQIIGRLALTIALAGGVALFLGGRTLEAKAQQAQEPAVTLAQTLVGDVDDIDRLRSLNPLKLTGDEIDKLLAYLATAQTDYDKQLTILVSSPLKEISGEIKTTKKLMLAGGTVPKAFDTKVKKIQTEYLDKKNQLYIDYIGKVTTECRKIMDEEQIASATKLEKTEYEKAHPGVKATDAQLYNQFVVDTFMGYYRIMPLLKEMKSATK